MLDKEEEQEMWGGCVCVCLFVCVLGRETERERGEQSRVQKVRKGKQIRKEGEKEREMRNGGKKTEEGGEKWEVTYQMNGMGLGRRGWCGVGKGREKKEDMGKDLEVGQGRDYGQGTVRVRRGDYSQTIIRDGMSVEEKLKLCRQWKCYDEGGGEEEGQEAGVVGIVRGQEQNGKGWKTRLRSEIVVGRKERGRKEIEKRDTRKLGQGGRERSAYVSGMRLTEKRGKQREGSEMEMEWKGKKMRKKRVGK